jgi:hypothetical protein
MHRRQQLALPSETPAILSRLHPAPLHAVVKPGPLHPSGVHASADLAGRYRPSGHAAVALVHAHASGGPLPPSASSGHAPPLRVGHARVAYARHAAPLYAGHCRCSDRTGLRCMHVVGRCMRRCMQVRRCRCIWCMRRCMRRTSGSMLVPPGLLLPLLGVDDPLA